MLNNDEITGQSRTDNDPVIEAYKRDVDRSLIRYFLKLTPEQRLLSLEQSVEDLSELRRAAAAVKSR